MTHLITGNRTIKLNTNLISVALAKIHVLFPSQLLSADEMNGSAIGRFVALLL
jgi:hypothetical protein